MTPSLWRQTFAILAIAFIYLLIGLSVARPQEFARTSAGDPWEPCGECHNLDGISSNGHFPHLAGQPAAYIMKEIADFSAGERINDHGQMGVATRGLLPAQRAAVARHFAKLSAPLPQPANLAPNEIARAATLVTEGDRAAKIPACGSCHGAHAKHEFKAPQLEAQQPSYLAKELADFRAKRRTNDPNHVMQLIAERLSDSDIEVVTAYLAGRPRNVPARSASR